MVPETSVFQAADGADLVFVFDRATQVMEGRTDRRMNRQNCDGYDMLQH